MGFHYLLGNICRENFIGMTIYRLIYKGACRFLLNYIKNTRAQAGLAYIAGEGYNKIKCNPELSLAQAVSRLLQ